MSGSTTQEFTGAGLGRGCPARAWSAPSPGGVAGARATHMPKVCVMLRNVT